MRGICDTRKKAYKGPCKCTLGTHFKGKLDIILSFYRMLQLYKMCIYLFAHTYEYTRSAVEKVARYTHRDYLK